MTIDLSCQKCEASFEIDAAELLEGLERIKCPNCDARAPQSLVEELSSAFGDLCKVLAAVNKKFTLSLSLESDDLPAPYDQSEEEEAEEEEDLLSEAEEDEEDPDEEEGSY